MKLPVNYNYLDANARRTVRNIYMGIQNGLCAECKESLSGPPSKWILGKTINKNLFPENFFKFPVHLHHDHDSGLTIGAVHCECNAVLWQYYGKRTPTLQLKTKSQNLGETPVNTSNLLDAPVQNKIKCLTN